MSTSFFTGFTMVSAAVTQPLAITASSVAYTLFGTRIGVCGIAWHRHSLLALQLPEATTQATVERMLHELALRLACQADGVRQWTYATGLESLPAHVVQAVAGVQQLLVGWRVQAGLEEAEPATWFATQDAQVLGDLRSAYAANTSAVPCPSLAAPAASGLPTLLDIDLDWQGVPDFARSVYRLARLIPPGSTRTYGDLAQDLGGPGLARAVGQALGANPFAPVVPCHRVLAAGREPGGFSGGQGALTKLRMLELEGAAWGGTRSLFE